MRHFLKIRAAAVAKGMVMAVPYWFSTHRGWRKPFARSLTARNTTASQPNVASRASSTLRVTTTRPVAASTASIRRRRMACTESPPGAVRSVELGQVLLGHLAGLLAQDDHGQDLVGGHVLLLDRAHELALQHDADAVRQVEHVVDVVA